MKQESTSPTFDSIDLPKRPDNRTNQNNQNDKIEEGLPESCEGQDHNEHEQPEHKDL